METLFPGRCLLCGEWLLPDPAARGPLCTGCRDSMRRPEGPVCSRCGVGLISEHGICTRCREADYTFESNRALFPYTGDARRLLQALKFGGRLRLAAFFADQAAQSLGAFLHDRPIVPVPARPGRRTPDPVGKVCSRLAADHGGTVLRLLERTGGAQQKSLDLQQRRENLLGRIRLRQGVAAASIPARVTIVDDVFTTGATIDACARVLAAAGCSSVRSLTLVIEE
jgi:predicted amidophosphoribosyltransferase